MPCPPAQRQPTDALKTRGNDAEDTLRAIPSGKIDTQLARAPTGTPIGLQGAEMPYRLLLESLSAGVLGLNTDGTIFYANRRLAELTRRPLEQIVGAHGTLLFTPQLHDLFQQMIDRADDGATGELMLVRGDGSELPVQVSTRGMMLNEIRTMTVVVTDMGERKAAEEVLRRNSAELESHVAKLTHTVAELERFSYSMSHDLRAPLSAIQGYATVLQEEFGDLIGERGQDFLRRIANGAGRLDRLIQDVLRYSVLANTELELAPISVEKLIRQVIESFADPRVATASITLVPPLPIVRGNRAALTQCFANLLSNAIKYTIPGRTPEIRIWAEARGDEVRIWFEDRGIGIEKNAHERIFEMFQRAGTSKKFDGHGLGLAIVRKAIERMGGRVGVESEPGKGSRFWLELRAADAANPSA